MDQCLCSFGKGLLGMDRAISYDLEDQFFIVCLLLDTIVLYAVLHVLDRCIDRVSENGSQWSIRLFILFSRYITTTLFDGDLQVEIHLGVHFANNQFRVEHLETGDVLLKITGSQLLGSRNRDGHCFVIDLVDLLLEAHLLQVQHDLGHIFHHTGDRREFVVNTFDTNRSNCKSFQGRKQYTSKGVTNGQSITWLEWAKFEFPLPIRRTDHDNFIWLLKTEYGHSLNSCGLRLFRIQFDDELLVDALRDLDTLGNRNKGSFLGSVIPGDPLVHVAGIGQGVVDHFQ